MDADWQDLIQGGKILVTGQDAPTWEAAAWLAETPRSGAARVASEVSRGLPKAALMPPTIAPRLRCASGGDPTAKSDQTCQLLCSFLTRHN